MTAEPNEPQLPRLPIDVVFDMETQDPDDAFTLALLASWSSVRLCAVTITPGSREQVAVVREVLRRVTGQDDPGIPVGARDPQRDKPSVSRFHYDYLGPLGPETEDGLGHDVMAAAFREFPQAVLLTGAAVSNARLMHTNHDDVRIARWVAQGGFAGDNVVPAAHRLEKFAGLTTCPTFNFNGDPKGARLLLDSDRVGLRQLVSKNVCHGVVYDQPLHDRIRALPERSPGLDLVMRAMDRYLQKRPSGKAFHDPLAACVMIDPSIATLAEVEVYREKGEWGSKLAEGTNTFISVAINHDEFVRVLTTP